MTRLQSDGRFGVRRSDPEPDPTVAVIVVLCLAALIAAAISVWGVWL